jgi:hypothetical protein
MTQQFGFRAAASLSEVQDRDKCWDNLGINRNDLPLIVNTGVAGVSPSDYFAINGLQSSLENQIVSLGLNASTSLSAMEGKVSKNGDSGVATIFAENVNNDRPYYDAGNNIYGPSVNSFFSPPSPSGFGEGGEYKLGTVTATTTTVSGFNYNGKTAAWNDYFVRYKKYLAIQEQPSWTQRRSPLYLPPPSQIAGNTLWLDSEFSSFVQDGAGVRQWRDVLNRGGAIQEVAANQPALTLDRLNGRPGVVFDGSNDFLSFGNISGLFPTGATVVIVATLGEPNSRGDSDYNLLGTLNNTGNRWRTGTGSGSFGLFTSGLQTGFPSLMPANGTYVFTVKASQDFGLEIRANSLRSDVISNRFTSNIVYDPGSLYVVGANANASAGFFGGTMYAMAFFNRVLEGTELNTLEKYFAWRYDFLFDPDRSQPIELENEQSLLSEGDASFVLG